MWEGLICLRWTSIPQDLPLHASHTPSHLISHLPVMSRGHQWALTAIYMHTSYVVDEEMWLLESSGCISNSLCLWHVPGITVPKKPDPSNPGKQHLCLVLDYCLLNKSIKATHNGKNVISYYPLLNISISTNRKWHWNVAPFRICPLPGVFCYLMLQVLPGLDFVSHNLMTY